MPFNVDELQALLKVDPMSSKSGEKLTVIPQWDFLYHNYGRHASFAHVLKHYFL